MSDVIFSSELSVIVFVSLFISLKHVLKRDLKEQFKKSTSVSRSDRIPRVSVHT